MSRRDADGSTGQVVWPWRVAVTVALLALFVLADRSESIQVPLGMVLTTGMFGMVYDLFGRFRWRRARQAGRAATFRLPLEGLSLAL